VGWKKAEQKCGDSQSAGKKGEKGNRGYHDGKWEGSSKKWETLSGHRSPGIKKG